MKRFILAVALAFAGVAGAETITIEQTGAAASAGGVGGTLSTAGTDGRGFALDGGTQTGTSQSSAQSSNPRDDKSKASATGSTSSSSLTGGVSSRNGSTYGAAGNATGSLSGASSSMTTITLPGHGHH